MTQVTSQTATAAVGRARRKIAISSDDLVKTGSLNPGQTLPLVIEPATDRVDVLNWAEHNRSFIQTELLEHGAVLFRGFPIATMYPPAQDRLARDLRCAPWSRDDVGRQNGLRGLLWQ